MAKKIFLTESQLRNILKYNIFESCLINEALSTDDIYNKYYIAIPREEFDNILAMDPTTKNGRMGEYCKWLLKLYSQGGFDLTDGNLINGLLSKYHKAKLGKKLPKELSDVNHFKTLNDLSNSVSNLDDTSLASQSEKKAQAKDGAEVVYESNKWLIIVPHTKEAAIQYGKGTKWCTAALNKNRFDTYNNDGPIYTIINKDNSSEKYQIHFESGQFMDAANDPVDRQLFNTKIDPNGEILSFFEKRVGKGKALSFLAYDDCYGFHGGFAVVCLEEKGYNFINADGKLLSPNQWFSYCCNFIEGFGRIEISNKCNFIDAEGNILSPNQWFDYCDSFNEGVGVIRIGGQWNYIDTEGNLLSPNQWFDSCSIMVDGLGIIRIGEKSNFIKRNGELLSPNQWFDECYYFNEGFAIVYIYKKGYNFINSNGDLLSPNQWFDKCWKFNNGLARVELDDEQNYIDTNGDLLSPSQWFDNCWESNDGLVIVQIYNKGYNFIDANGNILSPNQWFDDCSDFNNGFAEVQLNDQWYKIDRNGNIN